MTARTSPLHDEHEAQEASFTEFGGWTMPVEFGSIREEHQAVRTAVGVFDVSHMGELEVSGPDAEALLQGLTSNDVTGLSPGKAQYAAITNEDGVMLEDTIVYRLPDAAPPGSPGEDAPYCFIPNAGHDAEMHEWATAHAESWGLDADVQNMTEDYGMIALQGPEAEDVLASVSDASVRDLGRFRVAYCSVEGTTCLLARTGYTGEDGFELLVPWEETVTVWRALDAQPCGLGARDTLRMEMGYLLSGQDFHPEENPRTPFEAGIDFAVSLETDFIGGDALAAQRERGLEQTFVGFSLVDRGVPRHGYPLTDTDGTEIGSVTSGTMSPSLRAPIGLGYVDVEFAEVGTELGVVIRGESKEAIIGTTPFLDGYQ